MKPQRDLKYPIGKYLYPTEASISEINERLDILEKFPNELEATVKDLTSEQLNWIYRPEGWTIKQVVHHCADSHINSIVRFKWALTEDSPTIKAYVQNKWAELPDAQMENLQYSISILHGVHARLIHLLRNTPYDHFDKYVIHPEHGKKLSLKQLTGQYAWHSKHHLAHIRQALEFKGTFDEI